MRGFAFWVVSGLPVVDALTLAALAAFFTRSVLNLQNLPALAILLLVVPLTQHFLTRLGLYDSHRVESPAELVRKVLIAHLAAACLILGAAVFMAPRLVRSVAIVFAASFVILALTRAIVHAVLQSLRKRGFDRRNVLLSGTWEQAETFALAANAHPQWGLRLDCVATGTNGNRVFRSYPGGEPIATDVESILKSRVVDEVLLTIGDTPMPEILKEARVFEQFGAMVRVLFEPQQGESRPPKLASFAGGASLEVGGVRPSDRDAAMKRVFDVVVAAAAGIVALPTMIIIAILVKLTSPGPVLFFQTRVGLNGRRFRMFKFRTMVDGAELLVRQADRSITHGPIFKDPRDYRITPLGRLLRKFSLDELPQLWNVLRGDMSIVGPRPLPVYEAEMIAGEYRRRFSVPPGLTCIWQVSGRSDVTYERWMKYDLEYIDRWSLWSDAMLVLKTIPVVVKGRGGY